MGCGGGNNWEQIKETLIKLLKVKNTSITPHTKTWEIIIVDVF